MSEYEYYFNQCLYQVAFFQFQVNANRHRFSVPRRLKPPVSNNLLGGGMSADNAIARPSVTGRMKLQTS